MAKQFLNNEDVFGSDFGKPLKDLDALLQQNIASAKELAKTMQSSLSANQLKSGGDVQKFAQDAAVAKKAIDDVAQAEKARFELEKSLRAEREKIISLQEKLNNSTSEAAKQQAALNLELKRQAQINKENAILESEKSTQYEKNVVLLNRMYKEIMALGGLDKAPKELANQFSNLEKEVRDTEQSVGKFQRNVGNYASAKQELKALEKEMVNLKLAGKDTAEEFVKLRKRAGELRDTIEDTRAEIKYMASDTRVIDGMVGSVNLLAHGFQVAEGALSLMGDSTEEWQQTMVKLQAIMAITSGLQEVQNALQKESAAMMFLSAARARVLAAAQSTLAFATGGASTAMNVFRTALLATGIGAAVILIGYLVGAMNDASDATDEEVMSQEDLNAAMDKYNQALQKTIDLAKIRAAGARGSAEDLKRELNLMRAKGESEQKIYEQEQKIRQRELKDLKDVLDAKVKYYKGTFALTEEFYKLNEDIRNKQNEIDVAEKKRAEEEAKRKQKAIDDDFRAQEIRARLIEDGRQREITQENLKWKKEKQDNAENYKLLEAMREEHLYNLKKINEKYDKQAEEEDKRWREEQIKTEIEIQKAADDLAYQEYEANKRAAEEAQKAQEEEIKRQEELAKKKAEIQESIRNKTISMLKEVADYEKNISQTKISSIDAELNASRSKQSELEALAAQGQLNAQQSLAAEQKKQAQLEAQRDKEIKKQQEQALILAGIEAFITATKQGSSNPAGEAGSSINTLMGNIKNAVSSLKAFKDGGLVEGGEQIVRINEEGQEYVVNAASVKRYGKELLDDINSGNFSLTDYALIPPINGANDETLKKLDELKKAIEDKPVPHFALSEITGGIKKSFITSSSIISKHYKQGKDLF